MVVRKMKSKGVSKVLGSGKRCRFCNTDMTIDYKDLGLLRKFINMKGKISSRRINRNCARHQRRIAQAVKRARFLALLPYQVR